MKLKSSLIVLLQLVLFSSKTEINERNNSLDSDAENRTENISNNNVAPSEMMNEEANNSNGNIEARNESIQENNAKAKEDMNSAIDPKGYIESSACVGYYDIIVGAFPVDRNVNILFIL